MSSGLLERHEFLFKTYFKPLVVYAVRLVGDKMLAEDVVQEVFARLWKKKEEIEYGDQLVSYLFASVKNACMNHSRHLKIVHRYNQESSYQKELLDNPFHYLMLHEIEQKMEETLDELPKKSKDVFIMSRFGQKKNREIAKAMNISIKTVEAHITRVLSALRKSLRHYTNTILLILLLNTWG